MGAMYRLKAYFGMVPAEELTSTRTTGRRTLPPGRRGPGADDGARTTRWARAAPSIRRSADADAARPYRTAGSTRRAPGRRPPDDAESVRPAREPTPGTGPRSRAGPGPTRPAPRARRALRAGSTRPPVRDRGRRAQADAVRPPAAPVRGRWRSTPRSLRRGRSAPGAAPAAGEPPGAAPRAARPGATLGIPDHHAAAAGATTRRGRSASVPRRHAGDHEPDRAGRRGGQATGRLRRRSGLRAARLDRQGHQPGVPAHPRRTWRSPPRTPRKLAERGSSGQD